MKKDIVKTNPSVDISVRNRRNRNRGKSLQRRIAKKLNGKNIGIIGGHDVETELFAIECKSLKSFVGVSYMEQAIKNCPKTHTPMVVVHVTTKKQDDLVILNMKNFISVNKIINRVVAKRNKIL